MSSSGQPALAVIKSLRDAHRINVWIDRGVDHSQILDISVKQPTLEETFAEIADQLGAEVAFAEPLVIIGPPGKAEPAASAIFRLRETLRLQANASAKRLLKRESITWSELTSPTEIADLIRQIWKADVPTDSLEHDLWGELSLQEIDAVGAAVLLTSGFGLTPSAVDSQGKFTLSPTPAQISCTKKYPVTKVPSRVIASIRKLDPQVQLKASGTFVTIRGSARVHHHIGMQQLSQKPVRSIPGTVGPLDQVYTMKVKGMVPVIAVLNKLCGDSKVTLDTAGASSERLQALVTLVVEDQTVRDILGDVCVQANLAVTFGENSATVSDR